MRRKQRIILSPRSICLLLASTFHNFVTILLWVSRKFRIGLPNEVLSQIYKSLEDASAEEDFLPLTTDIDFEEARKAFRKKTEIPSYCLTQWTKRQIA